MFRIPWLHVIIIWLSLIAFLGDPTSVNFYKIALLCSAINQVWLIILRYVQATVAHRTTSSRPPPKPDPSIRQKQSLLNELLLRVSMAYLPSANHIILNMAIKSNTVIQITAIILLFGSSICWLSAVWHQTGRLMDMYANDGRSRGSRPWIFSWNLVGLGQLRVIARLYFNSLLSVCCKALTSVIVYSLIFIGLSLANWLGSVTDLGDEVGVWVVFYMLPKICTAAGSTCLQLMKFVWFDVPSALSDLRSQDSLEELSRDIDQLLAETADDWSLEDPASMISSLTAPPRKLPPVKFLHSPTRFWRLMIMLVGLCSSATGQAHENLTFEASTTAPSFLSDLPKVNFSRTNPGWRTRRKYRRWSQKAENTMVDSKQFWISQPQPSSSPSAEPSVGPLEIFLSKFNPATAGLQLLITERLDRLHHHVTIPKRKKKHSVAVDLRRSQRSIIATASKWFIPAADESVFNSIGSGIDAPLIVDSGASCCITPHKEDFTSYVPSKVKVKDLSGVNKVAGEGLISWKVVDRFGAEHELELKAYHMPGASVRLLSPQSVFNTIKGSDGHQNALKYTLCIPSEAGDIILDANYGRANLPLLQMSSSSTSQCLWSSMFAFSATNKQDQNSWARGITHAWNLNLTAAQKELLLWHFRLSHAGISSVHALCRERRSAKVDNTDDLVRYQDSKCLPCTHKVPNTVCDGLLCAACLASKSHRRSPINRPSTSPGPEMVLKQEDLSPGDCISCDHYISPIPGRAIANSGYSSSAHGYNCGTIYVDHASGFMFVRHQTSTSAAETIRSKLLLEREARDVGVKIRKYHSDNGVFSSKEFKSHCDELNQKLTFSGVGAKFQNGVAERGIQTVSNMAKASMIHASIHWPGRKFLDMWPLAMQYTVWVHNRLPPNGYGVSPEELWSGVKCHESHLPRAHVFGCPVYVLDPKLQDGKQIPKWNSKVRQGVFVGFSPDHSTNVPLVYNPKTQHISPQFHVIFDDHFSTTPTLTTEIKQNEIFQKLYSSSRECFVDAEDLALSDAEKNCKHEPLSSLLDQQWLTPEQRVARQEDSQSSVPTVPSVSEGVGPVEEPEGVRRVAWQDGAVAPDDGAVAPDDWAVAPDDRAVAPDGGMPAGIPTRKSARATGTWKNGPVKNRSATGSKWKTGLLCGILSHTSHALSAVRQWGQPPPSITNVGGDHHTSHGLKHEAKSIMKSHLSELALLQSDWDDLGSQVQKGFSNDFSAYFHQDLSDELGAYTITDVQPHLLKAKLEADPDNPTYTQAMQGPHQLEWWKAMGDEMETLEGQLDAWSLVVRESWMNVLPSKWAFKLKRFPDGLVKKFKARFVVRGDRQVEGVDFFETWSPVVQWTTVRTMMTLASKLGLKSCQADITAAFVHAPLEPGEEIYVKQPKGHERPGENGKELVLKLNRSVYGLRQSPRNFFQYLKGHLDNNGLHQSQHDPCLFIGRSMIVVVYVDDVLMFSKDDSNFDKLITSLKNGGVAIRKEGTAEGFLGVDLVREDTATGPMIKMLQTGLTKRVIEALGLSSSMSTSIDTPAEASALLKDAGGLSASGNINYPAVIGMLLYLSGHSRPDIAFAVHQCARYTFNPTRRHELALIRIGRYLKGTKDKGLISCAPTPQEALIVTQTPTSPDCMDRRTPKTRTVLGVELAT